MTAIDSRFFLFENFLRYTAGNIPTGTNGWVYNAGTFTAYLDSERNKLVGRWVVSSGTANILSLTPPILFPIVPRKSPFILDVNFSAFPNTDYVNITFIAGSTGMCQISINSAGDVYAWNNVSMVLIGSGLFSINNWYSLEAQYNETGNQWIFMIDGKKYGPFTCLANNNPDTLGSLTKYQITNGLIANSFTIKLDNFYHKHFNAGLQIYEWAYRGILDYNGSENLWKINKYGGPYQWDIGYSKKMTSVESITSPGTYQLMHNKGNTKSFEELGGTGVPFPYTVHKYAICGIYIGSGGKIGSYIFHNYTGGLSQIAYFNGTAFSTIASPPANQRVLFFYNVGSPNYLGVVTADNVNPCTGIHAYSYATGTNTWGNIGNYGISQAIDVNYGLPHTSGLFETMTTGAYFCIGNGGNTLLMGIGVTGPGFQLFYTITGVTPAPENACYWMKRLFTLPDWSQLITLWTGSAFQTWEIRFESVSFTAANFRAVDSNKYVSCGLSNHVIINDKYIARWSSIVGHCIKLPLPAGTLVTDTFLPDIAGIWKNANLGYYYLLVEESVAASFELRVEATGKPSQAEIYYDPALASYYKDGFFYEFYDGFRTLAFTGRVFNPRSTTEKASNTIKMVGMDYEALQKFDLDLVKNWLLYNIGSIVGTGLTTSLQMKYYISYFGYTFPAPYNWIWFSLRAKPNFLYERNSFDFNADFNLLYLRIWQASFSDIINFIRHFERAIIYYMPDGKIFAWKYTRAASLFNGIRWTYGHPQVTLLSYEVLDMKITKSEVIGANTRATGTTGQIRYVYNGNPAIEASEGISYIKVQDSQIINHNEAVQYATNRFKIYTNEPVGTGKSYFIKLRVKSQGYLQPGNYVEFEWNDGTRIIPRNNYLIIQVDPIDLKNDIADVWLTDNIVTFKEFTDVQKTIGRDTDVSVAMYDGSKASTTQGTLTQQNSVSRLRAGTYEWRVPEPTAWDFTKTSLPAAAGETATINLSNIIPDGVRAVHIRVQYKSSTSASYFLFKKFGMVSTFQGCGYTVDNTGKDHECLCVVGVSDDRKIDVYSNITQANWTTWNIVIIGWNL